MMFCPEPCSSLPWVIQKLPRWLQKLYTRLYIWRTCRRIRRFKRLVLPSVVYAHAPMIDVPLPKLDLDSLCKVQPINRALGNVFCPNTAEKET